MLSDRTIKTTVFSECFFTFVEANGLCYGGPIFKGRRGQIILSENEKLHNQY